MEMLLTDIQILALLLCLLMSYIAYRARSPAVSIVPCIGLFLLGFDIYSASDSFLLLGLLVTLAVSIFVICYSRKRY